MRVDLEAVLPAVRRVVYDHVPNVRCVCVFGSAVRTHMRQDSDIDVALLCPDQLELFALGRIVYDLELAVGRRVDLVELLGLPERHPSLAFEIARDGILVDEAGRDAFVNFKTQAFLHYLDTQYLRDLNAKALRQRMAAGTFARQLEAQ